MNFWALLRAHAREGSLPVFTVEQVEGFFASLRIVSMFLPPYFLPVFLQSCSQVKTGKEIVFGIIGNGYLRRPNLRHLSEKR